MENKRTVHLIAKPKAFDETYDVTKYPLVNKVSAILAEKKYGDIGEDVILASTYEMLALMAETSDRGELLITLDENNEEIDIVVLNSEDDNDDKPLVVVDFVITDGTADNDDEETIVVNFEV